MKNKHRIHRIQPRNSAFSTVMMVPASSWGTRHICATVLLVVLLAGLQSKAAGVGLRLGSKALGNGVYGYAEDGYEGEGKHEQSTRSVHRTRKLEEDTQLYPASDVTGMRGCYKHDGYVSWWQDGGYIEWNSIEIATSGKYIVIIRYASQDSNVRKCDIFVNDEMTGTMEFQRTGGWTNWNDESMTKISLKQGRNKIRVAGHKQGPNIVSMIIIPMPKECNVKYMAWIGDGYCDRLGGYNTPECGYDGGDCCLDTCTKEETVFSCDPERMACEDIKSKFHVGGNSGPTTSSIAPNESKQDPSQHSTTKAETKNEASSITTHTMPPQATKLPLITSSTSKIRTTSSTTRTTTPPTTTSTTTRTSSNPTTVTSTTTTTRRKTTTTRTTTSLPTTTTSTTTTTRPTTTTSTTTTTPPTTTTGTTTTTPPTTTTSTTTTTPPTTTRSTTTTTRPTTTTSTTTTTPPTTTTSTTTTTPPTTTTSTTTTHPTTTTITTTTTPPTTTTSTKTTTTPAKTKSTTSESTLAPPRTKEIKVPNFSDPMKVCPVGRVAHPTEYVIAAEGRLGETSYMCHSTQTYSGHPVMWMGSDGAWDTISAVDLTLGTIIRTYKLNIDLSVTSDDWESISRGPCTSTPSKRSKSCLYIGNIGNNPAGACFDQNCRNGRDEVKIYKIEEPDLNDAGAYDAQLGLDVVTLRLNYHHWGNPMNRANSESMFVDFTGDDRSGNPGDIYMITKTKYIGLERLVKVPARVHEFLKPGESVSFSVIPVGKPTGTGVWNGADMSDNGRLIAVRNTKFVKLFPRTRTMTVRSALEGQPCAFSHKTVKRLNEQQFESVAFMGMDVAEAAECDNKAACANFTVGVFHMNYEY